MLMICPKSKRHKKFITTAHVMQEWEVDGNGTFCKVIDDCMEVTHDPNIDNIWTCKTCGAEAIIGDENFKG